MMHVTWMGQVTRVLDTLEQVSEEHVLWNSCVRNQGTVSTKSTGLTLYRMYTEVDRTRRVRLR